MVTQTERSARPAPLPELWVSCDSEDTFLFAYVANLSSLGIFVPTESPLPVGSPMFVRFAGEELALVGEVAWVNPVRNGSDNPNPGMGVLLGELDLDQRDRLVSLVRAIAYLDDPNDGS